MRFVSTKYVTTKYTDRTGYVDQHAVVIRLLGSIPIRIKYCNFNTGHSGHPDTRVACLAHVERIPSQPS